MKFNVHKPGWQFCETHEADNEKELREKLREQWKVKRLPNGTAIWPYQRIDPGGPYSAMRYMM